MSMPFAPGAAPASPTPLARAGELSTNRNGAHLGAHLRALVLLHWVTAACVLIAVAAGLLHDAVDSSAVAKGLMTLHRQAGLTALLMLALRVPVAWADRRLVARPVAASRWAARSATLVHLALYLLLLAVPLLGWQMSDAAGRHPALWGLLPLPTLQGVDPDQADLLQDRHEWLAWTLVALVGLHAAAAAWHHWVLRDGLLRRMGWPRR